MALLLQLASTQHDGMAIFPSGRIALSFDDWGCDISNLNLQEPANAIKQFR